MASLRPPAPGPVDGGSGRTRSRRRPPGARPGGRRPARLGAARSTSTRPHRRPHRPPLQPPSVPSSHTAVPLTCRPRLWGHVGPRSTDNAASRRTPADGPACSGHRAGSHVSKAPFTDILPSTTDALARWRLPRRAEPSRGCCSRTTGALRLRARRVVVRRLAGDDPEEGHDPPLPLVLVDNLELLQAQGGV